MSMLTECLCIDMDGYDFYTPSLFLEQQKITQQLSGSDGGGVSAAIGTSGTGSCSCTVVFSINSSRGLLKNSFPGDSHVKSAHGPITLLIPSASIRTLCRRRLLHSRSVIVGLGVSLPLFVTSSNESENSSKILLQTLNVSSNSSV